MGVKLMTGATGEQNIQAADDRECLAGITGLDSYVFPTGSRLKATLVDSNNVTIGTGAGSLQGSRFRCATTTNVTIQSGTQGQYRHDIIGLRFNREASGREVLEFVALTGTPAASEAEAKDPEYAAGDLLAGDATAFMPLYRVRLAGINVAAPEAIFSVLTPIAALGESVSLTWKPPFTGDRVSLSRTGNVVVMSGNVKFTQSVQCNYLKVSETLPEGFKPIVKQQAVVFSASTNRFALIFDQDGSCVTLGNPSSEYACCTGCWVTSDEWTS